MKVRLSERHLLFAAAAILVPFAAGCGPATLVDGKPVDASLSSSRNARVAYMVNSDQNNGNGDFRDPALIGRTSAQIAVGGGKASYTPDSTAAGLSAMEGLTETSPGSGSFTGPKGYANVTAISDVDKNGTTDDTFLVFIQNNPVANSTTEYSYAYAGTRAPTDFVNILKTNNHVATYTGTSSLRGAIGNDYLNKSGTLNMKVEFGKTGTDAVTGNITNLVDTSGAISTQVDSLTFGGKLLADGADIDLSNVQLQANGATITKDMTSAGAASLFGPRAGGTIGVLSGTGATLDGKTVNVLGAFTGSTTDNN